MYPWVLYFKNMICTCIQTVQSMFRMGIRYGDLAARAMRHMFVLFGSKCYLSIYLSIFLSIYPSIHLYISMFISCHFMSFHVMSFHVMSCYDVMYVYIYYQRKFHGGNSELRTFTFSLAQRSLCPVGMCLKRS